MPAPVAQGSSRTRDAFETTRLDTALQALADTLRDHSHPESGLWDPQDQSPTPPDHYGQISTALALTLLDGDHSIAARNALTAWQALPTRDRGHAPFNRFLLNLLADCKANKTGDPREASRLRGLARDCRLARGYPSNNWTLLARLCDLQEAPALRKGRAARRLLGLFDKWTTPDGAFIDYPAHPGRSRTGATPAAYHHKALFVAVMAAEYGEAEAWQPIVARLLQWSLQTWDGHGHVGGLGRSSHALFGDACLVASLILLGAGQSSARETATARMLHGILDRWQAQTRADGFIALNPADRSTAGCGYDPYMHLSVYNAWTAAIVSWARHRATQAERAPIPIDLRATQPFPAHDPHSEQFRVGNPATVFALVSGRGQPPQAFSRSAAELRYAGGVPLHMTWQGQPLCPAPARVSLKALQADPALAGWTPIFESEGVMFGLTDFDSCEVTQDERLVRVSLSGHPRALHRPPITGLPARALAALDWRLLGGQLGRQSALRRPRLEGIAAHLELTIHLDRPRITQRVVLDCAPGKSVRYLNPGGHAVTQSSITDYSLTTGPQDSGQIKPLSTADWLEAPMPSAIAGAIGRSLPAFELCKGRCATELVVKWASRGPTP